MKKEKQILPQTLLHSLDILHGMVRRLSLLKYLGAISLLCLSSWAFIFSLDRFIDTPQWFRILLSISSLFLIFFFCYQLILEAYILPRSHAWLARRIKDRFGGPGDRLLGIIELNEALKKEEGQYSKALFFAAQERVETEISKLPLIETFNRKRIYRLFLTLGITVLIVCGGAFNFPELAYNSFQRWIKPWKDIPRATLTKFNPIPETWILPRNEDSRIKIQLSKVSKSNPNIATILDEENLSIQAERNQSFYEFSIPSLNSIRIVRLKAGDYRKELTLKPVDRPEINQLHASIFYPAYLELPPSKLNLLGHSFNFPFGTSLQIEGTTTRSISSLDTQQSNQTLENTIQDKSFSIQVPPLSKEQNLNLHFTDSFNLSPIQPRQIQLIPLLDQAPKVGLPENPSEATILLHETIPIRVSASDDYGIARFQLCMVIVGQEKERPPLILFDQYEKEQNLKSEFTLPFDPDFFDLEDNDKIEIYGQAWDRMPNREPSISRKIQFQIIGIEKHAEQLRDEIESIIARTSEITRDQENILLETTLLEQDFGLQNKDITAQDEKKLNRLADLQRENAQNLKNASMEGMNILDDAIRNPIFKTETLEKFAQIFKKLESVALNPMSKASKQIDQAITQKSFDSSRNLQEAKKSEQEALDQLTQILSEGSKQLDRLEAQTLAQRLRKIEKIQRKTSEELIKILPLSIGQPVLQLNSDIFKQRFALEEEQRKTHIETGEVKGEISRYHERTGKLEYGKVSQLMESAKPEEKILFISNKIQQNISFVALDQLDVLSEKFGRWADILENSDPTGAGGEGQGVKNSETKDFTKIILSLLKIRDSERNIIAKTTVLQNGNFQARRENWTAKLQLEQEKLMIDLTDAQIDTAEEAFNPIFDDAHMAMSTSAVNLSNSGYGINTLNAQKEARNLVSDLINLIIESSPKSNKSQENEIGDEMSSMEFLLLQMKQEDGKKPGKMMPGSSGGGSNKGGNTEKENNSPKGQVFKNSRSGRKSMNSSGSSHSVPAEFKDIMENYFQTIE